MIGLEFASWELLWTESKLLYLIVLTAYIKRDGRTEVK